MISKSKRLACWMLVLGPWTWGCDGGGGAVVENPTLVRDVEPLMRASCGFGASCHGTAQPAGLVQLTLGSGDAAALRTRLLAKSRREPSLALVTPGDPSASFLMHKVWGDFSGLPCGPSSCGERMPQRSSPLPEAEIELLERWIQQGAPLE